MLIKSSFIFGVKNSNRIFFTHCCVIFNIFFYDLNAAGNWVLLFVVRSCFCLLPIWRNGRRVRLKTAFLIELGFKSLDGYLC